MLIFNANQLTSLQKIFVIVLILYPTFTFFRAYLESPTQDYITKGKTIKKSILKKKKIKIIVLILGYVLLDNLQYI